MFANNLSLPRPEYPRPDRQRGHVEGSDWLNLNGPWQFRFDLHRVGVQENWASPASTEWHEQIIVPFCWESLAAWGEGDTASNDHYYSPRVFVDQMQVTPENHRSATRFEVGWYRRLITIPASAPWLGKRVILTVGAADFFTDCWCNGIHLGRHEGGYVPFEFDLTDTLPPQNKDEARTAFIVLRVEDPMDNREQPVGKQRGWYTTTSGIWQTMFIEPRSATCINSFHIYPNIDDNEVRFEVVCAGVTQDADVAIEIKPPSGHPQTLQLLGKDNSASGTAKLASVWLWGPGHPHLYTIQLRLKGKDGELSDEIQSYFGMRKISTAPSDNADAPGMLCLNNHPIYVRGALYQSYHPDGVYTATEAATLSRDISYALEMGFDLLRVHIKLDDPILLYYADTLGMMLMQDFPNFGEGGDTPLGHERFVEMMRQGIERDFNHPSIIAWCIFNESWGFGGQNEIMKWFAPKPATETIPEPEPKFANTASFTWVHQIWLIAKSLDPTRLIEDMSVVAWNHLEAYGHVETDINSWHFYINDYKLARAHISDVVAKSYRGSKFNYIEGFAQSNAPLINSEYGGVGALDGDRDISWSFKFLTNELRLYPQLSAYIFTELTDVEWERNGFLNYDRSRKEFGYLPTMINQGDVLPINAPPIQRVALGKNMEVEVMSSHFSRIQRKEVIFHWDYSGMDTLGGQRRLDGGQVQIPFSHHRVELARRIQFTVPSEQTLCTLSVSAVGADGQTIASNFVQQLVGLKNPPEREDRGHALILRRRVADWNAAEWSGGYGTREEATRRRSCYGRGAGFFEWHFSDDALRQIDKARRIEVLFELSARREGITQTDSQRHPTNVEVLINGLPVYRGFLPDHPHDARGSLSYLTENDGAYGFLVRANVENDLLHSLGETAREGQLNLRCAVHDEPHGGLTVYDWDCGRFPIGPTIIVEWTDANKERPA